MSDEKNEPTKGRGGRPLVWVWIVLASGALFYLGVLMPLDQSGATVWGVRGDAVAPFAALLNAGALLALLRSVGLQGAALDQQQTQLELQRRELRLQRKELKLQREEMKASREEMQEQRKQFERTAKAQEDLAVSQAMLAAEQREANRLARFAEVAQRRAALASLYGVVTAIDVARAQGRLGSPQEQGRAIHDTRDRYELAGLRIREEAFRIDFLEGELGIHRDTVAAVFKDRESEWLQNK